MSHECTCPHRPLGDPTAHPPGTPARTPATATAVATARIVRTYKTYQAVDGVIAIAVIATPLLLGALEERGLPGMSLDGFMTMIGNLPPAVIIPVALASVGYTTWSMWLYVKVWPVEEIPKGFDYWFDWVFIFAILLVR